MNNNILFLMFGGLMILIGLEGETKAFAQSITPQTDQVMENNQHLIYGTNETTSNVSKGLIGIANGTGNAAGNITEGLNDAVNETGEAFSNTTKDAIEGIHNVINGSSQ